MTTQIHLNSALCADIFRRVLFVLFVFIFFSSPVAFSNACDQFHERHQQLLSGQQNNDSLWIESTVQELLNCHQQNPGQFDSLIPAVLLWHYRWQSKKLNADQCLALIDQYTAVIRSLQSPNPEALTELLAIKVRVFWFRYQLDSIDHYLSKMENLFVQVSHPVHLKLRWYYNKGRYASTVGDYESAMVFYKRGLEYLEANFPDDKTRYYLLNAIGIGYRRSGKPEEAIRHYEKILKDLRVELNEVRLTGTCLNNLGLSYKDNGEWAKAIPQLMRAIDYYKEHYSPGYADIGSGYDNIAICYFSNGDLDSALYYSKKSYAFVLSNFGESHPDVLLSINSITRTLIKKELYHEALEFNTKAKRLLRTFGWSENNPGGDFYFLDGLDVFSMGLKIYQELYNQTKRVEFLHLAMEDGEKFMGMTDYAYDHLKNELSKDIFLNTYSSIFSHCVSNLYTLFELTQDLSFVDLAFQYADKFKSLELMYAAQKDKADQVPQHKKLNIQYETFTDSIQFFEEQLFDEKDAANKAIITSGLNRVKEQLYAWKENIRKNHPKYYALIYHPEPVTLNELKASLRNNDQSLLSYHVAHDAIYIFVVRHDTAHFVKQPLNFDLSQYIEAFRESIYGFHTTQVRSEKEYLSMADQFVRHGLLLYNALIAPVHPLLNNRVAIIVDKSLGYLPFDLLLSEKPKQPFLFRDHNYLILDHAISYSYSARLWLEMQTLERGSSGRVLAVAPSFPERPADGEAITALRTGLTRLYYNETEVNKIASIIPGKTLMGKEATKEKFIQYSPSYSILHLATHGKANDEQSDFSFLSFTDVMTGEPTLSTSEIYLLDLNADLVTLSACETGLGALRSGEGIISIARAFSFAGAKGIVSTLWSVNDKSTSAIMTRFYKYIKSGDPKDIAMQKAKVGFYRSLGHADANPFFWGGFICVGDMQPIKVSNRSTDYVLPGALALSLLLILFLFRKKLLLLGTS